MTTASEQEPTAPITGLSHLQLLVNDVAASDRWYTTVLGLVPFAQDLDIGYVALRQPDTHVVVVLSRKPRSGDGAAGSSGAVLDHLAFAVADEASLRAWAAHLTGLGIAHDGVVPENGHPTLQLRDPDGIAIELVAP